MAVLSNLHAFESRGTGSFIRWARAVGRHRMLQERDAHDREAAARSAFAHQPTKPLSSPVSRITSVELEQQLEVAFSSLTQMQRTAVLSEFEELDDAEVAEEHDMSVRALRMHRARGRASLARQTQKMRKTPLPRVQLSPKREGSSPPSTPK